MATTTQELADLLKALGEFNRLSLVYELCECKAPRNAMCLCVLAQEGVVEMEKQGRERIYSLNREEVAHKLRALADRIEGAGTELSKETEL